MRDTLTLLCAAFMIGYFFYAGIINRVCLALKMPVWVFYVVGLFPLVIGPFLVWWVSVWMR